MHSTAARVPCSSVASPVAPPLCWWEIMYAVRYARSTEEELRFIQSVMISSSVLLDPVYTVRVPCDVCVDVRTIVAVPS